MHGVQDGCLLERVLKVQAGDASPQMPSPALCFTECELALQVSSPLLLPSLSRVQDSSIHSGIQSVALRAV